MSYLDIDSFFQIVLLIALFLFVYRKEKHVWSECALGPVSTTIFILSVPFYLVKFGFIVTNQNNNAYAGWIYLASIVFFGVPVLIFKTQKHKYQINVLRSEMRASVASMILISVTIIEFASNVYFFNDIIRYGLGEAIAFHAEYYAQLTDASAFLDHSLPVRFLLQMLGYSGLLLGIAFYIYRSKANKIVVNLAIVAIGLFLIKSILIAGRGLALSTALVLIIMGWKTLRWKHVAILLIAVATLFTAASFIRSSGYQDGSSYEFESERGISNIGNIDWLKDGQIKALLQTMIIYGGHSYVNFCHYIDLFSDGPFTRGVYSIRGYSSILGVISPDSRRDAESSVELQTRDLVQMGYIATQWSTFPGGYMRDFGCIGMLISVHLVGWMFALVSFRLSKSKQTSTPLIVGITYYFGLTSIMFPITGFYLGNILIIIVAYRVYKSAVWRPTIKLAKLVKAS